MERTAILLTCFNRKNDTLSCIKSLFRLIDDNFDVYLVDDGSTDGTAEAIKCLGLNINIIQGNGSLFWNRGMHLAWEKASSYYNYDFYLWLNDDVCLYTNCIAELFKCSLKNNHEAIISGIVESQDKLEVLYGGFDQSSKLITPNGTMQAITNMNGNIVLIPRRVFIQLGNLDKIFHHDLGDVDYGLRARKVGINVLTTTIPVAYGTKNSISRLRQKNTTISNRFKKLYSPIGNPPSLNYHFRKRHKGLLNASAYWIFLHFINIVPDKLNSLLFKNKY